MDGSSVEWPSVAACPLAWLCTQAWPSELRT